MNEQRILEELLALLEANGVSIRHEPLAGGAGGLCTVKNQHIFFVDTQSTSSADVAALAAEAVAKIVNIEGIYLRPEIRQFIESHGSSIEER
jgi:UDP-N-acetylenolpyruvoylglucosamine reductase